MARILVIEDEANIRITVRMALQHVGHSVEVASDGSEGLAVFGSGANWDLVLLDQRMPGMDGLEVLSAMRGRSPAARVVMITAYGTPDLAKSAAEAGAAGFLRKPFTAEVLRSTVSEVLAHQPA